MGCVRVIARQGDIAAGVCRGLYRAGAPAWIGAGQPCPCGTGRPSRSLRTLSTLRPRTAEEAGPRRRPGTTGLRPVQDVRRSVYVEVTVVADGSGRFSCAVEDRVAVRAV